MSARNRFEQQLETLGAQLITMGALCEESIGYAMAALFQRDGSMAQKAFEAEAGIDHKEREIENLCMSLLLRQQPVAGDLRVISSALKMISDMERIGDHAEDIAEIAADLSEGETPLRESLEQMAEAAAGMVTRSVDSFVKRDVRMAYEVIASDDWIDGCFDRIKNDLAAMLSENGEDGRNCIDALMIAKYLERVADHATNIGEWVIYSITGAHPEGSGGAAEVKR